MEFCPEHALFFSNGCKYFMVISCKWSSAVLNFEWNHLSHLFVSNQIYPSLHHSFCSAKELRLFSSSEENSLSHWRWRLLLAWKCLRCLFFKHIKNPRFYLILLFFSHWSKLVISSNEIFYQHLHVILADTRLIFKSFIDIRSKFQIVFVLVLSEWNSTCTLFFSLIVVHASMLFSQI